MPPLPRKWSKADKIQRCAPDQARASTGGEGLTLFASNFARMKESIFVRGQLAYCTFGGEISRTGWNAHHFRPFS